VYVLALVGHTKGIQQQKLIPVTVPLITILLLSEKVTVEWCERRCMERKSQGNWLTSKFTSKDGYTLLKHLGLY